MKKYIYLAVALIVIALFTTLGIQRARIQTLKADNEVLGRNQHALLTANEQYKVADSLNAVSTLVKELRIGELEKYRAEDVALIKQLRADKKDIEAISTAKLEAAYAVQGKVRDSIVYRDKYIADTLRCVTYHSKWLDFDGCFTTLGVFDGRIACRDELLYVEHVKRARFLGFLWRTQRIKERRQEIVSKNPHTTIKDAEFISIRE